MNDGDRYEILLLAARAEKSRLEASLAMVAVEVARLEGYGDLPADERDMLADPVGHRMAEYRRAGRTQ